MRSCLPLWGALLGLEHYLLSDVPVQKHVPSKRNLSCPSMPQPGDFHLVPDLMFSTTPMYCTWLSLGFLFLACSLHLFALIPERPLVKFCSCQEPGTCSAQIPS